VSIPRMMMAFLIKPDKQQKPGGLAVKRMQVAQNGLMFNSRMVGALYKPKQNPSHN